MNTWIAKAVRRLLKSKTPKENKQQQHDAKEKEKLVISMNGKVK